MKRIHEPSIILARALSACHQGIRYGLGCGGYHPENPLPCVKSWRKLVFALWLDCSGFISWCIGMSRKVTVFPGKWGISTVSIYADAMGPQRVFYRIPLSDATPGCLLCYPDKGKMQGHVAILVSNDDGKLRIVDCGSSSSGVTVRDGSFFNSHPFIVCRVRPA